MIEEMKALFTFGKVKKETKPNPVIDQLEPPKMEELRALPSVYCFKILYVANNDSRLIFKPDAPFEWRCDDISRFSISRWQCNITAKCCYAHPLTGAVLEQPASVLLGEHNRIVSYHNGSYAKLFVELTREAFNMLVGSK